MDLAKSRINLKSFVRGHFNGAFSNLLMYKIVSILNLVSCVRERSMCSTDTVGNYILILHYKVHE